MKSITLNVSKVLSHLAKHDFEETAAEFDVSLGKLHSVVASAVSKGKRLPASLTIVSR